MARKKSSSTSLTTVPKTPIKPMLSAMVKKHGLTADEREDLEYLIETSNVQLSYVDKLLDKKYSLDSIISAYNLKRELTAELKINFHTGLSIINLVNLMYQFPSFAEEEEKCEKFRYLFNKCRREVYIRYPDKFCKLLVETGESYNLTNIETAVDWLCGKIVCEVD